MVKRIQIFESNKITIITPILLKTYQYSNMIVGESILKLLNIKLSKKIKNFEFCIIPIKKQNNDFITAVAYDNKKEIMIIGYVLNYLEFFKVECESLLSFENKTLSLVKFSIKYCPESCLIYSMDLNFVKNSSGSNFSEYDSDNDNYLVASYLEDKFE